MSRVGLGVVTCNRPDYIAQVEQAVKWHLSEVLDEYLVVDAAPSCVFPDGLCVGQAKNIAMRALMEAGCDWIVLGEDDVLPTCPEAVTGYVSACERSGFHHLMRRYHGHWSEAPPTQLGTTPEGVVTFWTAHGGTWGIYSAACLNDVGLHDEGFNGAFEHVELTARLAEAGYTTFKTAEPTGAEPWVVDIPGSMDDRAWSTAGGQRRIEEGREHWKRTHPETYRKYIGTP